MITSVSCDARLDFSDYHEGCVLPPRHSGSHYGGLYYWETGGPPSARRPGNGRLTCLGLAGPAGAHVVVERPEMP